MNKSITMAASAAAFLASSTMVPGSAAAVTTVTGRLIIAPSSANGYDGSRFRPNFGCMNTDGATVAIGNFTEFCYIPASYLVIAADFSNDDLQFYAYSEYDWQQYGGPAQYTQEFTFSDSNYLDGITLVSSDYRTLTYTVSGNKLTIVSSAPVAGRYINARFTFNRAVAAVPEPASWAMMLSGFGMIGAASRYRRRKVAVAY